MKRTRIGCLAVCLILLQVGCASRNKEVAKNHLIEAKTTIHTAKLMGAGAVAPTQMAQAENHYRKAESELRSKPKSGWLFSSLRDSAKTNKRVSEKALLAKKAAEDALRRVRQQEQQLKRQKESLEKEINSLTSTIQAHQEELERAKQRPTAAAGPQPVAKKEPGRPDISDPKTIYMKGFYLFHEPDYDAARKTFEQYLKVGSADLKDNAQFWIGECFFMQKKYKKAAAAYRAVLSGYPKSNKSPEVLLKLGLCHSRLKNYDKSKDIWRTLIKRYPKSRAAAAALGYLKRG